MSAIKSKTKVRATTVPIRLSDNERAALNIMAAQKHTMIADIVTKAVRQMYGKELEVIANGHFFASGEQ